MLSILNRGGGTMLVVSKIHPLNFNLVSVEGIPMDFKKRDEEEGLFLMIKDRIQPQKNFHCSIHFLPVF